MSRTGAPTGTGRPPQQPDGQARQGRRDPDAARPESNPEIAAARRRKRVKQKSPLRRAQKDSVRTLEKARKEERLQGAPRAPVRHPHGHDAQGGHEQIEDADQQPQFAGDFGDVVSSSSTAPSEKLHKVLARAGVGSRRAMEAQIAQGRVMVNGVAATLGFKRFAYI